MSANVLRFLKNRVPRSSCGPSTSPEALRAVVNYIYGSDGILNADDAPDTLKLAHQYGLDRFFQANSTASSSAADVPGFSLKQEMEVTSLHD